MKKNYIITIITILATTSTSFGQIGWWPFNANANDESGNGNHGTVMGATLTTDRFGIDNSAYLFDGTASYITIPTSTSLESPTTHLSMSAWVNLSGMSIVGFPFAPIFMKSNSNANSFSYRFIVSTDASGFSTATNNWFSATSATEEVPLNEWFMVSIVLDSTMAYFYYNDSLVQTEPYITNINSNTMPLEIGRDTPGDTEVFYGKIDDVGIWSRALDSLEIDSLYNISMPTRIEDLVEKTRFNVYPNPTNDIVNIVGIRDEDIIVFNSMGAKIEVLKGKNAIDMSTYSKGLFFIQLINDAGHIVYKERVFRQ